MPLHVTPYPHVLNSLNGPTAPKYTYLIFYSSFVDGQMWCPDCRNAEQNVKEVFEGDDKPKGVILYVGDKPTWRDPENEYRKEYKLRGVPTMIRMENGKEVARIEEDEDFLDKGKLEAFVNVQ
ncbi:thioredoxin-like protein [Kockovaella imperatae]|uniref:Thioredoxin-like protein n=1 Tax=Kockovaella imperatae TaxID=4999 RepID=A0A1Y1UHT5_9TREE|nr:thioredoxin-like protein [Kockovaella imperatae]ORX37582.1 thioredoxin-like protein [Kockovaella imperatae]